MNILIVEDDEMIRKQLSILLESNNYKTIILEKFDNVVNDIKNINCNLILLDVNLNDINGFEVCKKLKNIINIPIIFVTCLNSEEAELKSILSGGSDFIIKPYNKTILLEKIKRCLNVNDIDNHKEIKYKDLTLDLHLNLIRYNDKEEELTRNEFKILYYLLKNPNKIISKDELLEKLWNDKYYLDENILSVNINRIRKKLKEIGAINFIETIHKKGYRV